MRRKNWRFYEKRLLIEHYKTATIQELIQMLGRTADSINSEIKRLKLAGKLEGYKKSDTVTRSLKQR